MFELQYHIHNTPDHIVYASRFDTVAECIAFAVNYPNCERYAIQRKDASKACGWSSTEGWINVG